MRRQLAFVLAVMLAATALPASAGQNRARSAPSSRRTPAPRLGNVERFKEAFQNDTGKIRLVALVSPT